MRIPRIVAGGVIAVALTATAAGAALAQTPAPTTKPNVQQRAEEFLNAFAAKLGKTPAEVRAALVGVQKDRIAAEVAAGRLTQQQADQLNQRLDQNPAAGLGGGGFLKGPGAKGGDRKAPAKPGFKIPDAAQARGAELATFLGATPQELRTALTSGKSLAQFAQDKGKTRDQLKAHLAAAQKTQLDAGVAAGRITQAQADQRLARYTASLDQVIDRVAKARPARPGRQGPGNAPAKPQGTGA